MAAGQEFSKFDDVFMGILQNCGKIEPFLEAVFNFLSRRTDFFRLMHKKDDKLGFPPGYAEKMLIKIFEKYQMNVLKNDPIYQRMKNERLNKVTPIDNTSVPPAVKEVEIETKAESNKKNQDVIKKKPEGIQIKNQDVLNDKHKKPVEKSQTIKKDEENKNNNKSNLENSPQVSNLPDSYNGAVTERYTWSQTISDVDIKIPVPSNIKKAKDITVIIKPDSINVSLKQEPIPDDNFDSKDLLQGKLSNRIKLEETIWSLEPCKCITITLEKSKELWWTSVLEGDKEIDKQSIDTTQHVQDFDVQTQADIRKVMYDQQQKMMGKPTSDEQKTYGMLEKAWDAEGSPFKGTPFDPTSVNLLSRAFRHGEGRLQHRPGARRGWR